MSKTTNRSSLEARSRAARMVFDHEQEYRSRWAAVSSIATKIGCTTQSLDEWVKRAEVDSGCRFKEGCSAFAMGFGWQGLSVVAGCCSDR